MTRLLTTLRRPWLQLRLWWLRMHPRSMPRAMRTRALLDEIARLERLMK